MDEIPKPVWPQPVQRQQNHERQQHLHDSVIMLVSGLQKLWAMQQHHPPAPTNVLQQFQYQQSQTRHLHICKLKEINYVDYQQSNVLK
jgi:hypothetical protein